MKAQLDLELSDIRVRIPWSGESPRSLTRVQIALFLKRERQKDDCFFVDPDQLDLFLEATVGPLGYRGAPLLLPLP